MVRCAAALLLGTTALLTVVGISYANGARPLLKGDFFGIGGQTAYLVNDDHAVIGGTKYPRAVEINTCGPVQGVSINTRKLAGYRAISFVLGLEDRSPSDATMTFVVTADGNQVYKKLVRQGSLSTVQIPFDNAQVLNLSADTSSCEAYLLLANPVALPGGATSPAPPPIPGGKATVKLFSATVAPGGQQVALVATAGDASVTLVVDYPNGSQIVIGPMQAGADGHLALTWTIPSGVHGTVHVTVDSEGKVLQGTFSVS
jgi:hypothetical protein